MQTFPHQSDAHVRHIRQAFALIDGALRKSGLVVKPGPCGLSVSLKCAKCDRTDDLRKCPTASDEPGQPRYLCPACRKIEDRREDCRSEHEHDRYVDALRARGE